MTVPLSQKISGNRSYSVVFGFLIFRVLFPFWKGIGSCLCLLFLGSLCIWCVQRSTVQPEKTSVLVGCLVTCGNCVLLVASINRTYFSWWWIIWWGRSLVCLHCVFSLCYAVTVSHLVFLWETPSLNLAVPFSRSSKGSSTGSLPFTVWKIHWT